MCTGRRWLIIPSLFREEELQPLPDSEIHFATWKCRVLLSLCILATAFTLFLCLSYLCPVSEQTHHFIHRFFRNAFLLRSSSVNAFMGSLSPSASFTEASFIYASSSLPATHSEERIHQLLVVQAGRRAGLAARLQQRVLHAPTEVLRIRVLRLDGQCKAQHLLPVLVSVENARLIGVVHELVVYEGVQGLSILLGDVAHTTHTHRIASEQEGEAVLLGKLIDERIGRMTRSGNHLERDVIQLHRVAVIQHLFHFGIRLDMSNNEDPHVLIRSSVHGNSLVLLDQFSKTEDVFPTNQVPREYSPVMMCRQYSLQVVLAGLDCVVSILRTHGVNDKAVVALHVGQDVCYAVTRANSERTEVVPQNGNRQHVVLRGNVRHFGERTHRHGACRQSTRNCAEHSVFVALSFLKQIDSIAPPSYPDRLEVLCLPLP